MKMGFTKKSISLNLWSLSGYACLLVVFYTIVESIYIWLYPNGYVLPAFDRLLSRWYYPFLIQTGLVVLAIIEFVLYKWGKLSQINIPKMPAVLIKFHPYIFWFGIFLVFIPIYWVIFNLCLNALFMIFK